MSHITTVDVEIINLDALKRAAERCGLEFREGKETFKWYGRHVGDEPLPEGFSVEDMGKCEHAIGVRDNAQAYEIGVARSRTGSGWTLLFDFWEGGFGLEERTGKECETLLQMYALEVAREEAQSCVLEGWQMEEVQQPNGDIQLVLTQDGGLGW